MGWCLLRLSAKILALLRLSVNFFHLRLTKKLKINLFCFKELRANVCNFRESVDSREFLNFFIFCPHNLYSTLLSKLTLKLITAFYFFLKRAKFEKRQIGALSSMKLAKIKHFLRART